MKQVISLLDKHNSDESVPGVDIIVMDTDHNSIKLLDIINKRPSLKQTSSLPLISTVMVLPEIATGGQLQSGFTSKEALQHIDDVGGAGYICPHNISSQDLLFTVVEALCRRKMVEVTFRDLKAAKIKAKKYPFIPVFSKAIGMRDEDDEDTDDDFADGFEDEESKMDNETDKTGRDSRSSLSLKELDDWTDSSSLLPSFVQNNRKRIMKKSKSLLSAQKGSAGVDATTATLSIQDRQQADKAIVKLLNTGGRLPEESVDKVKSTTGTSVTPRKTLKVSTSPPVQGESATTTASVADADPGETRTAASIGSHELDDEKTKRAQSINAAANVAATAAAAAASNSQSRGRGPAPMISMGSAPLTSASVTAEKMMMAQ